MTLTTPAKINLYLAVGPIRHDGYHSVNTVFLALDFGDVVTVAPAERLSLVCEPDVGVPVESNLAWRAAVAMGETFGRSPDFAIRIDKRVPAGAGLAGGSGDAAAVIAAIAGAWELSRDDVHLELVAASLGADVPFLLKGGCAVYGGRGDVFRRKLKLPAAHFAVVAPGEPVPTAAAYEAFDRTERQAAWGARGVTDALSAGDFPALCAALYNNMTEPAIGLVPVVGEVLRYMEATHGCCSSLMCGSGSAVFGMFATAADAEAAVTGAQGRGWWGTTARPRPGGTLDDVMGVPSDAVESRRRDPRRR